MGPGRPTLRSNLDQAWSIDLDRARPMHLDRLGRDMAALGRPALPDADDAQLVGAADIALQLQAVSSTFRSIATREGATVTGVVVLLVMVYLLMNLLVDLLYAVLDPRIRYD